MSSTQTDLTLDQVNKVLTYDPISGILLWNAGICIKGVRPSSRAGHIKKTGYRGIRLFGKLYLEHRLIWFIQTGAFPTGEIDHINQDRSDNSWANLREVTRSENSRNRSRNPDSKLGEHGIWFNSRTNKYVAEITVDGKKVYQKSFADIDQAISERKLKSIELGFHTNHGSQSK